MDAQAQVALTALRDIEGVLGSFLLDADGSLLARDLPPLFDPAALASASVHLSRLRAALELDGSPFESCVARFGPHLLMLRAAQSSTLCVLCPQGTNMPAVHMSTTLIARRLASSLPLRRQSGLPGAVEARGWSALEHRLAPEPAADSSAPPGGLPSRLFRGRPV